MTEHPLICHPDSPAPWLDGLRVRISHAPDGTLELAYAFTGELARLRIPPPAAAVRADGLWRHTCCEAFVMGEDAPAYREFNLAPNGQWQAYAFRRYREGGLLEAAMAPAIAWRAGSRAALLTARIPRALLPPGRLRLGLAVVVENDEGRLAYWALRHPPGRPDFHHTDGFALELEPTP